MKQPKLKDEVNSRYTNIIILKTLGNGNQEKNPTMVQKTIEVVATEVIDNKRAIVPVAIDRKPTFGSSNLNDSQSIVISSHL